MKTSRPLLLVVALLGITSAWDLLAQGAAFTYQGRLNDGGPPANGNYDLKFTLFDASAAGNPLGPGPLTNANLGVSNGLFTVTLDFGVGMFPGADRWLEIGVRTNGGTLFTMLAPRQKIAPTPYAITAENLISGGLAGTYTNAVTLNNAGNVLAGNGAGLVGVNAATVGGLGPAGLWQTGGNAGTTPGLNYLGTSDNQPLELKAGGARAMRLEPNLAGAPNVIGGAPFNAVGPGSVGSTIGGGGATNYFGFYSYTNDIYADFGVIGGGVDNHIQTYAQYAAIGGGQGDLIQTNSNYGVIAGGYANTVETNSLFTFIGGGVGNDIQANASDSTVGGGEFNWIQANADHSTIEGGHYNTIQFGANNSTIGGGNQNTVASNSPSVTIAGGDGNTAKGTYAVVGGGYFNFANAYNSTIGGGSSNTNNAAGGTIAGGDENFIDGALNYGLASIGGGSGNRILAVNNASIIAGGLLNFIQSGSHASSIGGGQNNNIQDNGICSVIAGGDSNTIQTNATRSTISGGGGNLINNDSSYSVLGGGKSNVIETAANFAVISGGAGNVVAGQYATVPGGTANYAGGVCSFAAGKGANAQNNGSFVWADSQVGAFSDTGPNQFLIRAAGGVGIGVTSPTAVLDVSGSQRVRGLFRNGSELGTSEAPSPAGLVVRRINSTSSANGQVVARTDTATLIRDGTAGGMLVSVQGNVGKVTITWMGIQNNGTVRGGNFSADDNVPLGYTAVLFANADNIVHAQITFGGTYLAGQHLTQVVIDRYDDTMTHDYYWSGTLISTLDQ